MPNIADTVWFTAGSSGIADFTDGVALTGMKNIAGAALTNGAVYSYRAEHVSDKSIWEEGYGAVNTAGTPVLARTTIEASSTGAKVNFVTAPVVLLTERKRDWNQVPHYDRAQTPSAAEQAQARTNLGTDTASLSKTGAYTVVAADYGALIKCAGTFTLSFAAAATLGDKFKCFVRCTSGLITLDPNSSETIDGSTTIELYPGMGCWVCCDGSNFFTIGRGVAAHSQSTNGYVKLMDGTILQWGNNSGADSAITFPVAFPNACRSVQVTFNAGAISAYMLFADADNISTTGFTARNRYWTTGNSPLALASGDSYTWLAIGY
jgi:tail fiber protein gp53